MQNTNPYYRSSYALVQRADAKTKVDLADRPEACGSADRRGRAHSAGRPTGPAGSARRTSSRTQLVVDTRYESPGRQMVEDVAAGEIDVGVLWGPIAGYWAKQADRPARGDRR